MARFTTSGVYTGASEQDILRRLATIQDTILRSGVIYDNWDRVPGQSKELTYYTGVAAGNPSGATTNIQYIDYKRNGNRSLRQTLTYDSNDMILTISAS